MHDQACGVETRSVLAEWKYGFGVETIRQADVRRHFGTGAVNGTVHRWHIVEIVHLVTG